MTGSEIDRRFDAGEDVLEFFELNRAERPNQRKTLTVDLPGWTVLRLEENARQLGMTREALIERWIAERLD